MKRYVPTLLVFACIALTAATVVDAATTRVRSPRKLSRIQEVSGTHRSPAAIRLQETNGSPIKTAPSGAAPGMVIGIDPATGATGMPTPEQMVRLRPAAQSTIPAPVRHPNGSISLDCRGWLREHYVVGQGADGRPVRFCVDGHDQAVRLMQLPPKSWPSQEER